MGLSQNVGKKFVVWIKAGSAWVNRDGSVNVYLDVLPLDGKLHIREPLNDADKKGLSDFESSPFTFTTETGDAAIRAAVEAERAAWIRNRNRSK